MKTDARHPGREDQADVIAECRRARGPSAAVIGSGVGRSVRGTDRPGSGAASSLSGDVRPGKIDQLLRPIQRSCVEEHAHGLPRSVRPDDDPPGWGAPELEAKVTDGLEGIRADPGSGPALEPVASDNDPACRQEHDGADSTQDGEECLFRTEVRSGETFVHCVIRPSAPPCRRRRTGEPARIVASARGAIRQAIDLPSSQRVQAGEVTDESVPRGGEYLTLRRRGELREDACRRIRPSSSWT